MNDFHEKHLQYYQREMSFLRKMGGIFAAKYPKIAKRLGLSDTTSSDPHVERLIESFAYLTSYLQKDIDNQFPRISSAMLNTLYPQQVSLIPPMSICQFEPDPEAGLTTAYDIPRNFSMYAEGDTGDVTRFKTAYPVEMWPIKVTDISMVKTNLYDLGEKLTDHTYALRIKLKSLSEDLSLLDIKKLRFFINMPRAQANILYQLIFEESLKVGVVGADDKPAYIVPAGCISQVGFSPDESVLHVPKNGHPAYTLLQEYFMFQKKYMFFDIDNLNFRNAGQTAEILIPLCNSKDAKSLVLGERSLLLNCAPIVNLFYKTSEPIRLDHQRVEYRLIPDHRREMTTEIHSIDRVFCSGEDEKETVEIDSYFSYNHHSLSEDKMGFWHARRVPAANKNIPGTDMHISFVNLNFSPTSPPIDVAYARVLCTNRQLAPTVPANALLNEDEGTPTKSIRCLYQPTDTNYPSEEGATQWQLISQLALNYLSLSNNEKSLEALKEMLRLYSGGQKKTNDVEINSLVKMTCEPIVRRFGKDAWRGFTKGTAVTITIDEGASASLGSFLFSSVLAHFFGLYTTINSFVEVTVKSTRREGIWKKWPPIAGAQELL